MIKPDLLKCFIAAADTGSFSAAGRLLGKHLATVSGNIARLEDELGVLLFDRNGKYPQLTEAGLNLYDGAKVAVDSIERFSRNALQLSMGIPAALTIAIDEDAGLGPFSDLIFQLQQKWPHLKLTVLTLQTQDIFEKILTQEVDIGITPSLEGNSQVYEFKAVGHLKLDIVCGQKHPLANKKQITNDDLMAHAQVISSSIMQSNPLVSAVKMSPTICESNGHSNIAELLRAGVGWAFLSRTSEHNRTGLVTLAPDFVRTQMQMQYDVIWPKNQPANSIHQFVLENIRSAFE